MKFLNHFLFFIFILNINYYSFSQAEDFSLWKEGKTFIFNSTGHSKSKGLNMSIKFPNNWTAMEGNRPNIVQKFQRNNKADIMAILLIKTDGQNISAKEITDAQTEDQIKLLIGDDQTLLASHTDLKIDGQSAFSTETYMVRKAENNVGNITLKAYSLAYYIFYKKYFIMVTFTVSNDPDISGEDIKNKFDNFKLAFIQIINSTLILSKWE